jgi:hypothetical protein
MPAGDRPEKRDCSATAHRRMTVALNKCSRFSTTRSEWYECARLFAQRIQDQARKCMAARGTGDTASGPRAVGRPGDEP